MQKFDTKLTLIGGWLASAIPLFVLGGPTVSDIAASTLAVLFLLHSIIGKDWRWLRERWVQIALTLALFLTVRDIFTPDRHVSLTRGVLWVRYPVFAAALAFWALRDEAARKRLLTAAMVAVGFLTVDTFVQYFFHTDLTGRKRLDYSGIVRLTGPFQQPRVGSVILALLFPVLLTRTTWVGLLLGIAAALLIFISGERMPFVLLMFGMGIAFLVLPRARAMLIGIGIAGVIGAVLVTLALPTVRERHINGTGYQFQHGFWQSSYGQIWTSALSMGEAHPLIGVGSKEFSHYCADPAYGGTTPHDLEMRCPMHPHNMYLQWFAETGAIGFALFCAMAGCWIGWVLRLSDVWSNDALATGLVVALMVRLWPISVGTDLYAAWAGVTLWLTVGWLLATLSRPADAPQVLH